MREVAQLRKGASRRMQVTALGPRHNDIRLFMPRPELKFILANAEWAGILTR
jgi:hypothetical protein